MNIHIWVAESLCCLPETIKTLPISYTPIQNTKLKVRGKKMSAFHLFHCPPKIATCGYCLVAQP